MYCVGNSLWAVDSAAEYNAFPHFHDMPPQCLSLATHIGGFMVINCWLEVCMRDNSVRCFVDPVVHPIVESNTAVFVACYFFKGE